jgi:hypothetical protein
VSRGKQIFYAGLAAFMLVAIWCSFDADPIGQSVVTASRPKTCGAKRNRERTPAVAQNGDVQEIWSGAALLDLEPSSGAVTSARLCEMRESGVRGVLVYCSDYKCSHYVTASADPWPEADLAFGLLGLRPATRAGILIQRS